MTLSTVVVAVGSMTLSTVIYSHWGSSTLNRTQTLELLCRQENTQHIAIDYYAN